MEFILGQDSLSARSHRAGTNGRQKHQHGQNHNTPSPDMQPGMMDIRPRRQIFFLLA